MLRGKQPWLFAFSTDVGYMVGQSLLFSFITDVGYMVGQSWLFTFSEDIGYMGGHGCSLSVRILVTW